MSDITPQRRIRPSVSSSARTGMSLAAGTLLLLALSACSVETDGAGPTSTPKPGATATKSPAATDEPTAAPEPTGTPVTLTCDEILTPDDVYAYNTNYGSDPGYVPIGEAAKTAEQYDGVACGWLNQTSGDIFEASVTQPDDLLLAELVDRALTSSNPVPTYGTPPVEGFFTVADGVGTAEVHSGDWWATVSSTEFAEPGDAQTLMASILTNLG